MNESGTVKLCPHCYKLTVPDFVIQNRKYFHCLNCDLIFKDIPNQHNVETKLQYYKNNYFDDHAEDQLSGQRYCIFKDILEKIETETAPENLLDVGCGCGYLLKEAKSRGWNIAGIDPSEESIIYSKRLLGETSVYKGTLYDISQEEVYKVITMINVLDHSLKPWSDIEKTRTLLKQGGLIYLRFPNGVLHSNLFKIAKKLNIEKRIAKFLVFHEYSFTPKFIKRLLSDHGFANIEIRNASPSGGNIFNRILKMSVRIVVNALFLISAGRIVLSPSVEVTARKK